MDDRSWDAMLAGLDHDQLYQLRQKIDQLLTSHSTSGVGSMATGKYKLSMLYKSVID